MAERDDRNFSELLQELRIGGLGVQVLFGFLLAVPFDARFDKLDAGQRELYVVSVLCAAFAGILLLAPVAFHRILFRLRMKEELVLIANAMALGGLVAVALAMTSALWLVVSVVLHGAVVPLLVVASAVVFALMWFVFPVWARVVWRVQEPRSAKASEVSAR